MHRAKPGPKPANRAHTRTFIMQILEQLSAIEETQQKILFELLRLRKPGDDNV